MIKLISISFLLCFSFISHGQIKDTLLASFEYAKNSANHFVSEGDDLYISVNDHFQGKTDLWFFKNGIGPKKKVSSLPGIILSRYSVYGNSSCLFRYNDTIFFVSGRYDKEYTVIAKLKNGELIRKDSIKLSLDEIYKGKSVLFLSGTIDSSKNAIFRYRLNQNSYRRVETPTRAYLKGATNNTLIFTLKDSLSLYSYREGKEYEKVFSLKFYPTRYVSLSDHVYFNYSNGLYRTDGTKNGTELIKSYKLPEQLFEITQGIDKVFLTTGFPSTGKLVTFQYLPKEDTLKQLITTKTGVSTPYEFLPKKVVMGSMMLEYVFTNPFDTGVIMPYPKFPVSIGSRIDTIDGKYYCMYRRIVNHNTDTVNFYSFDTTKMLTQVNLKPIVLDGKEINDEFFVHNSGVYYSTYEYDKLEYRLIKDLKYVNVPEKDFEIKVYPNPSLEILNIKTVMPINNIHIYSSDGRLCKTENYRDRKNVSINIRELKSGLYYLTVGSDDIKYRATFMKE